MAESCAARQSYFVIVDGFAGSGKSTLAGRLAAPLRAVHLELDSFLNKNDEGGYIDHTRYPDLRDRLRNGTKTIGRVILERVCVRAVLNRIGLTESDGVYVKRLVAWCWADGKILFDADSAQAAIDRGEARRRGWYERSGELVPQQLISQLEREVLTYHFDFRPHERSAFCVFQERRVAVRSPCLWGPTGRPAARTCPPIATSLLK